MWRVSRVLIFIVVLSVVASAFSMPVSASPGFSDGFEDEPADAGTPDDWVSTDVQTDGTINVTSDRAIEGSQSVGANVAAGDDHIIYPDTTLVPHDEKTTKNVSFSWYVESGGANFILANEVDGSIDSIFTVEFNDGELTTDPFSQAHSGVSFNEWINITIFDIDPSTDTVSMKWESPSDSGVATDLNTGTFTGDGYGTIIYNPGDDPSGLGGDTTVAFFDNVETAPNNLSGYVINNKTSDPVEDVSVTAFEQTDNGLNQVATTTTNAQGNWSLDVPDGQYELVYNNTSYFQALDNVTVSGVTDVGRQNLTPIPTAYINADPRNADYERNRTAGAFNVSIEMREPAGQGNQVTSRFMWYNRTADEFQEFNSITWDPSGGGVFVPQDFVVSNDWNNGTNRWFVNTTTDRGSFHSANYTFVTPGNITLVNAEDTDQVVDYSTVAIFIESLESDFDYSETITNGKFDLNDVPEEDLRIRFESRGGQDLLDRTLIIDESQIANLWSVAMINTTDFNAVDSTWYNQSFELDDQTGQWDSEDTYLLLSQRVGGSYKLVAGDTFGAGNNVDLVVNESEQYRLTLVHAVRGEIREKGFFEADTNLSDTTIVIPVRGTDSDFSEIDSGFQINASIVGAYDEDVDPPFLVIKYQDPDDKTFDLEFTVFERNNESNILRGLEKVSYDNLGTLVFEQALTSEEAKGEYVVEWSATRNGNSIGGRIIVGARGELGIPLATQDKTIIAVIIILIIAGLASQVNAVAVAMAVSGTSGIAWYIQWLPAEVGVTMLAVGMAVPAFYLAKNNNSLGGG